MQRVAAGPFVTKNKAEYGRIVNDMHAINLLMEFYNAKTKAAEQVLLYGYDHDAARLRQAESLLAASVDKFPRADCDCRPGVSHRDQHGDDAAPDSIPRRHESVSQLAAVPAHV